MTANEIIAQVKDLPMLTETARQLAVQLNRPELHRGELVNTVRCDSVLTAKLLRVCNSASSGLRERVVSVDQAILILGDNSIFRMVFAIGFGGALGPKRPGYDNEGKDLWTHSLSTGIGCEYLAEVEGYGSFLPSAAFTAGLLHDIGQTVIDRILTPQQRACIRDKICLESLASVDAERAVLGTDHCEVGACLLQRWSLPELIVEAVAGHHTPATTPVVQLSAVVYLADRAAILSGLTNDSEWEKRLAEDNQATAKLLGLDANRVGRIVSEIHHSLQILPQFKVAA